MLFLAVVGWGSRPAIAQTKPRLLFLGINSNGRAHPQAEQAVRLRLTGLELSVVRPSEIHVPPCENAECLGAAIASEHTDLALVGRVLKNEHACAATLWLFTEQDKPLVQHELVCRTDESDSDLAGDLAQAAGELAEDHLRSREPASAQDTLGLSLTAKDGPIDPIKPRWSWKKKTAVIGLSVLLGLGIAGAGYFAGLDNKPAPRDPGLCPDFPGHTCSFNYSFGPQAALTAALTAATAVSLAFIIAK